MNSWKARLALWLLRSEGFSPAIEIRRARALASRTVQGKLIGSFDSIREGAQAFLATKLHDGDRVTISVRAELGFRRLLAERLSTATPGKDDLPGDADLEEVSHLCDSNGPLIAVDGVYQRSCMECGKPVGVHE